MTCIIGLEQDGKVYIGGDSCASHSWLSDVTALPKVFRVGEFLIGYTDSFRMGQILQHHLNIRPQNEGEPDDRYLVTEFVVAVRTALKEHGYAEINSNREEGGHFLVGYRGHLYHVGGDFQINRSPRGFTACGGGMYYALGAMEALGFNEDMRANPDSRIMAALEVAGKWNPYVMPPYYVKVLE